MTQVSSTRVVNIQRYLTVLSQLPEVTSEQIEAARSAFLPLVDEVGNVTFSRGIEGDGKVSFRKKVEVAPGSNRWVNTAYYLDEYGCVENPETDFRARFDLPLSAYFFAGIFGVDEMSEGIRKAATKQQRFFNPFAPDVRRADPWGLGDSTRTSFPHIDLHFERLVAGLREFYAGNQNGLRIIRETSEAVLEAKPIFATLEADEERLNTITEEYTGLTSAISPTTHNRLKTEAALQGNAPPIGSNDDIRRLHAIVQQRIESLQTAIAEGKAAQQVTAQTAADENERRRLIAETKKFWTTAERMYRGSVGPGGGDSDVIRRIIDSYKPMRSYTSPATLKEARQVNAAAEAMLRELGNDDDGWEQFKRFFCDKAHRVDSLGLRHYYPKTIKCDEGYLEEHSLSCDFGVSSRGETLSEDHGCKNHEPYEPTDHGK